MAEDSLHRPSDESHERVFSEIIAHKASSDELLRTLLQVSCSHFSLCNRCSRPVLATHILVHERNCASWWPAFSSTIKQNQQSTAAAAQTQLSSVESSEGESEEAASQRSLSNSRQQLPGAGAKARQKIPTEINFDRHCAVQNEDGTFCKRILTCKSHPMSLKRAVPGRSAAFDVLLAAYQASRLGASGQAAGKLDRGLEKDQGGRGQKRRQKHTSKAAIDAASIQTVSHSTQPTAAGANAFEDSSLLISSNFSPATSNSILQPGTPVSDRSIDPGAALLSILEQSELSQKDVANFHQLLRAFYDTTSSIHYRPVVKQESFLYFSTDSLIYPKLWAMFSAGISATAAAPTVLAQPPSKRCATPQHSAAPRSSSAKPTLNPSQQQLGK